MRTIKFRQFFEGKFYYWGYIDGHFQSPLITPEAVDSESQQFTGLIDKNGKEIYEGDIVNEGFDSLYEIDWGYSGKDLDNAPQCWVGLPTGKGNDNDVFGLSSNQSKDCEVVGNIYDNPELIN